MNNKFIKFLIIIAFIGIFLGYQYGFYVPEIEENSLLETTPVIRIKSFKLTVSSTGTIEPVNSVEVSSKITARIKEILVKENDTVTAGDVVVVLDGKDYEAKRNKAKFNVTNTQSKYERIKYLHSIGAKSDEELEDAILNYDTARSDLEEAESDLAETIILAPISGTIVGKPKTVGTMVIIQPL